MSTDDASVLIQKKTKVPARLQRVPPPKPMLLLSTLYSTSSSLSLDLDSAKGSLTQQVHALTVKHQPQAHTMSRPKLFDDEQPNDWITLSAAHDRTPFADRQLPDTPRNESVPISSSILLHQGFFDLLGIAQATGNSLSRLAASSSLLAGYDFSGGYNAARTYRPSHPSPTRLIHTQPQALNRKRISVDMISRPMGFAHLCHASDAEQAEAILLQWQTDGIGKLPDPAWLTPIKEAAKSRARAQGIAQVQANRFNTIGKTDNTLKIVNPSSSIIAPSTAPVTPNSEASSLLASPLEREPEVNDTVIYRQATTTRIALDQALLLRNDFPPAKPLPFTPSLETLEKAAAAAIYFEQLYHAILKKPKARDQRLQQLELALKNLPDVERRAARAAWLVAETEYLRELRARVNPGSFIKLKVVGTGAFGVVNLVKEKATGSLFAMKQLSKDAMLKKNQEGHVRAERDFLAQAGHNARWIVRLAYSFQDADNLYLVLDWMAGGDMLNLLIEKDTFPEDMCRFYVAEMLLAIHEVHAMGFIHRDIKPDNFLIDSAGHLKLSDFGLATDFHWAHDGAYYENQRRTLLKRHGIDLEDVASRGTIRRRRLEQNDSEEEARPKTILTIRDKNRRKLAYSVVGTNNYMAPEVLRGSGYGKSCDFWSAGIIAFEMLFGYPCFVSKNRHTTRNKILNWRQYLKFPSKPAISRDAQDFVEKLVCEQDDRLGSASLASLSRPVSQLAPQRQSGFLMSRTGVEVIKSHAWFRGLKFDTLHLQTPPFVPKLKHEADCRYFEDDIKPEPLAPPDGHNPDSAKDPLLRDQKYGKQVLEVRKSLAFAGYTYKRPRGAFHTDHQDVCSDAGRHRGRPSVRLEGNTTMRSLSL